MRYKKIKGELIEFYTKDNVQLHGLLTSKNNKDIIIYVHGMGSNFYRNLSLKIYDIFLKNGFDLFSINTRGHDDVAKVMVNGERKLIGTSFEKFEDSKYDIKSAVNILSSLNYKNIILIGHSTGCQKVTYYLGRYNDKKVKAMILLAPSDDYNLNKHELGRNFNKLTKKLKNIKDKNKIFLEFYNKTGSSWSAQRLDSIVNRIEGKLFNYKLKNLSYFKKIKIPTLVVIGNKDYSFPKSKYGYIKILEKNSSSKKFNGIIIKNADHSFKNHEKEAAKKIVNWLKEVIK